jgi:hypothetical protein
MNTRWTRPPTAPSPTVTIIAITSTPTIPTSRVAPPSPAGPPFLRSPRASGNIAIVSTGKTARDTSWWTTW